MACKFCFFFKLNIKEKEKKADKNLKLTSPGEEE